jgi:predicted metal-dependent peptidase
MKLTAEQRVQKAHVWLMKHPQYCLYSGILMLGKVEVSDDVPTAATDGLNVKYGRAFVDKLSDPELRFLIMHENLHKAFRHMTTWQHLYKKNPLLGNKACDYVINLMIQDSDPQGVDVKFIEGGCLDERFRGLDAGTVFRMLEQDPPDDGGGGEDGEGEGDKGGGLDEHDWEGAQEMTEQEKQGLERDIDQALRQGKILAGKMNGNIPREVLEALEPKVDPREVLEDFITSYCAGRDESTWRRPNRRWISQDTYMPSVIGETVGRLVIAIDMSGSVTQEIASNLLGFVKAVCERVMPEGIDLLYWDTSVCRHEAYDQNQLDDLVRSTKPMGGGGTAPQCVPDFIKANNINAECAIVLTDGYVSSWGDGWSCPVLWGITTKGIVADMGRSFFLDIDNN